MSNTTSSHIVVVKLERQGLYLTENVCTFRVPTLKVQMELATTGHLESCHCLYKTVDVAGYVIGDRCTPPPREFYTNETNSLTKHLKQVKIA